MDFAKIVELFDRHGVLFVAVTQQFNTENQIVSFEPVALRGGAVCRYSGLEDLRPLPSTWAEHDAADHHAHRQGAAR